MGEAILTNIQNICPMRKQEKKQDLSHILICSLSFNGNVFGKKCCRCNEDSLYIHLQPGSHRQKSK